MVRAHVRAAQDTTTHSESPATRCSIYPPPPTDVTTGRRTRREDPKPDHLFVSGLGTGTTSLPCRGQKMVPSWGNGVGVLAVF